MDHKRPPKVSAYNSQCMLPGGGEPCLTVTSISVTHILDLTRIIAQLRIHAPRGWRSPRQPKKKIFHFHGISILLNHLPFCC